MSDGLADAHLDSLEANARRGGGNVRWLDAADLLSKTQIDRLGDRLRQGSLVEADLRSLDAYRRFFGEAYEAVVRAIRGELHLGPTGRPAKSTSSLVEKLLRESIRLSQVQDIAGCRLVVADMAEQERVVASLRSLFPRASVLDHRAYPSFGYRAVHVIVPVPGTLVEIQVRSSLQHLWAELSEKLADVVDPAIKYGGGPDSVRGVLSLLSHVSELIEKLEGVEFQISGLETVIAGLEMKTVGLETQSPEQHEQLRVIRQRLLIAKERHVSATAQLRDVLNDAISTLANLRNQQKS